MSSRRNDFAAPGGRGEHRLARGQPHLADGEGDDERHRRGVAGARVAVGGQRHRDAGPQQAGGIGVRRPGGELHPGQQGRDRRVRGVHQGVDVGRREVACSGRRWPPRARPPAGPRARAPAGCRARAARDRRRGRRAAPHAPRRSVKACAECGSQKTSTHRACGAPASSIGPVTRSRYAGPVARVLGRHHVRAQEGGLGRELAGDPQRPRLVVDGQPVAALDLDGGGALGTHLGDPGRRRARAASRRRRRGSRPRRRRCRHRRRAFPAIRAANSLAAVPGEDQVGVRVDEPGYDRAPLDVDPVVRGGARGRRAQPDDVPVLDDDRGTPAHAQAVRLRGAVTGDQLADVGDQGGGHQWCSRTAASAAPSRAAVSPRWCRPPWTMARPGRPRRCPRRTGWRCRGSGRPATRPW